MDFEFPEDTLMLRDMLRRFVQKEARPLEMDYFNTGSLKPEQRTKLRRSIEQLGLWGYLAPEKFGGAGLDLVTSCLIEEELGGTFIPLEMGSVPPPLYASAGDQVGKYFEPALEGSRRAIIAAREPGPSGVRPESWTTKAIPDGEAFLLNGHKSISMLPEPDDFLIVYALSSPQDETVEGINSLGITAFLVETNDPGLSISKNGGGSLVLKNCKVSRDNILGEPGKALQLSLDEATRSWILIGARYIGIVERLLEMAAEHARDWISLGGALAVRPAIQRMVAEIRVGVESIRWLVYHTAWLSDTQGIDKTKVQAAQVRLASGEMLKRAVDYTTMIYNGPSSSPQIDLQRLVQSVVPMSALELALENARAVVANEELHLSQA